MFPIFMLHLMQADVSENKRSFIPEIDTKTIPPAICDAVSIDSVSLAISKSLDMISLSTII